MSPKETILMPKRPKKGNINRVLDLYDQLSREDSKETSIVLNVDNIPLHVLDALLDATCDRLSSKVDREYFKHLLKTLIQTKQIPVKSLIYWPQKSDVAGKTRFDQIYDATMNLAFPDYSNKVLESFQAKPVDPQMKLWKAHFPSKYKVASVILRAKDYQDAFACACDYICRVSLRTDIVIPKDLTIRVSAMSEKSVKAHFRIRIASSRKRRSIRSTKAREFTNRQVNGSRAAALGFPPTSEMRRIVRYAEHKDMLRMSSKKKINKQSLVEHEHYKEHKPISEG